MGNLPTSAEIPEYTADGTSDQLFDCNRFIAANACGMHFASLGNFVAAADAGTVLEGVIAVDISKTDPTTQSTTNLPLGINVRGTLLFNLGASFTTSDKLVIATPLYINAANLSGVSPNLPTTYTSNYPPTFANPARRPSNRNLAVTMQ